MQFAHINVEEIEIDAFAKLEAEIVSGHSTCEFSRTVVLLNIIRFECCFAIVQVAFDIVSFTKRCLA